MSFNRMLLLFLLLVLLLFAIMVALIPVENAGAMAVSPTPYPYRVYIPIVVSPGSAVRVTWNTWEPCGNEQFCLITDERMCLNVHGENFFYAYDECTSNGTFTLTFLQGNFIRWQMLSENGYHYCYTNCFSYYNLAVTEDTTINTYWIPFYEGTP